ncbi:MAG: hypothetical protein H6551_12955 [Chitinophagales bacterium]|nr:hypothetical protein [Chitinophagaceae bacterium]MCB9066041.1 hypothetical protein [Chitinophagales bacterium]
MKLIYLLPNKLRVLGFVLLPVAIALIVMVYGYDYYLPFLEYTGKENSNFLDLRNHNLTDELGVVLSIISLFLIAFTKEKHEDEYLQGVRLKALQLSVYINYFVLALSTLLIYGTNYLTVMYANLFTILIIFIVVYYYNVHVKGRIAEEG